MESPLLSNGHGGFGKRSGETGRSKDWHRASGRLRGGKDNYAADAARVFKRGPSQSDAPVPVPPSHNRGTTMADEWPLRDFIECGALPGAVPCARLHARLVLAEWGLTGLNERAELAVSELVTQRHRRLAVPGLGFAGAAMAPVRPGAGAGSRLGCRPAPAGAYRRG